MSRKVLAFVLSVFLGIGGFWMEVKAAENNLGDPINILREEEEAAVVPDMPDVVTVSSPYAAAALLGTGSEDKVAAVNIYEIETMGAIGQHYVSASRSHSYCVSTPDVISFFDHKGYYNVVKDSERESRVYIQRYDSSMKLVDSLQIPYKYPIFGNITCDEAGNYYIIWGQDDTSEINCVTVSVAKYDYSGKYIAECAFRGYDASPYGEEWGTRYPFDYGNCNVTINNGVLACNYARMMYNGHQSNHVIYVDCSTMTCAGLWSPHSSHSFDQRVIGLSDGGFLVANQGDAYSRSFRIALVTESLSGIVDNFHFREGEVYQVTYAQLGGIAETANAYVFCASSERTLSVEPASANLYKYGYSDEARDLFIQILKKDFYDYSGADQYYVSGATRTATGTKPTSAQTELWLTGNEIDYGIIWLTDYDDNYYVNNPKVVVTDDNKIVVMWEKMRYSYSQEIECYYAILNEDGTVYQDTMQIPGAVLSGNIDPVYQDGKIYWTAEDGTKTRIYCLDLSRVVIPGSYYGDVNTELQVFSYDDKTGYLSGQIVVVEWVDTDGDGVKESTVPKYAPTMTFASTDGTESIEVFVTATGTNTYYFDRLVEKLSPNKEYAFYVTSGDPKNISENKTVPVYTGTSGIGSEGKLGNSKTDDAQSIRFKTSREGYLLLYGQDESPYEGHVNSLLLDVASEKSALGTFVSGRIIVTEWINGVSTVPDTTPVMTFESYDGKEVNEVFMKCLDGTNTYYFDRNLSERMDTKKEYVFRLSLTEPNNVSKRKSMVVTTNEMKEKEGLLWETDTQKVLYKTVAADGDNQLRVYAVDK